MKSKLHQKLIASSVNCLIVITLSLPIYLHAEWETFRISTVTLFALYNIVFRRRCIGMMIAGTYLERPASLFYIGLYTLSYSTFFWTWQAPFDLFLVNATCQTFCFAVTGNTAHGFLAGQGTVRA